MKVTYQGRGGASMNWRVTFKDDAENGVVAQALPFRHDLRNHSPTGFAWGYGGSGPAQLALALCAHATGDDALALRVYQDFKVEQVARWPRDEPFEITRDDVLAIISSIQAAHTRIGG